MVTTYPSSFEHAAQHRLADLPRLEKGAWRKVRTLGEAVHGKVYLAEARLQGLPRAFALKQLRREAVLASAKCLESAANELHAALAVAGLRLPYVAKVLFAAQDESAFYLATEYCPHGELFHAVQSRGYIASGPLLREILRQLLLTLSALHRHGIAHRDISLENILLAADGSIRLIDFGQAVLTRAPCAAAAELLVPPSSLGVPGKKAYRAPELSASVPYSASKVDMFACGVLLYTLAVGAYPSRSSSWLCSPQEEAAGGVGGGVGRCRPDLLPRLRELGAEARVPPLLLDLLEQLLAPDPERRLSAEEAQLHPWLAAGSPDCQPCQGLSAAEPPPGAAVEAERGGRGNGGGGAAPPPPAEEVAEAEEAARAAEESATAPDFES